MQAAFAALIAAAAAAAVAPTDPDSPLDLPAALALARACAPAAQAERQRAEEAAALLAEADRPFAEDPRLDLAFGWRAPEEGGEGSHDWSIGVGQRFEPSGRHEARVEAARVDVQAAQAGALDAELSALARAAELHLRAVHAAERRAALQQDAELARAGQQAVQLRVQAGAVSTLDARLAELNLGRARGAAASAAGDEARRLAELQAALGLEDPVQVTGALQWPWKSDLDAALAALARRPDLAQLAAEVERAEADERVAESAGRSDADARLGYARDDHDRVLTLGVSLALPVWGRGTGERAAAAARASRVRGQLAAATHAAQAQLRAAFAAHAELARVGGEEGDVAATLQEAGRLVTARWEAGSTDVVELLALRRELLTTQLAWLDRRLELALSGLEVDALSGRLAEEAP